MTDSRATDPISRTLDEIAEEFALLGDWEERYGHVIDLGRAMPPLEAALKTEATRVRGCASQVWLVAEPEGDVIRFRGDSDAHIVRGLVALVLRLVSGRRAGDILAFDAQAAFRRLGLDTALSPQRSNGLASMVARIRAEAQRLATPAG
jgi:cysteine desulfuration protein SufE